MTTSVYLATASSAASYLPPKKVRKPPTRKQKPYTKQEKLEAVRLVQEGEQLQTHVAYSLDVPESTLRGWVKRAKDEKKEAASQVKSSEVSRMPSQKTEATGAAKRRHRMSPCSSNARKQSRASKKIGSRVPGLAPVTAEENDAKLIVASSAEQEMPKVKKNEVSPTPGPKSEGARPKGRCPSSSSARKPRTAKKVCPAKDVTPKKRKRQVSGSDADSQPKRVRPLSQRIIEAEKLRLVREAEEQQRLREDEERQQREAAERQRVHEQLNTPEVPFEYKTVLEALGLVRRPDAVDLPRLE